MAEPKMGNEYRIWAENCIGFGILAILVFLVIGGLIFYAKLLFGGCEPAIQVIVLQSYLVGSVLFCELLALHRMQYADVT